MLALTIESSCDETSVAVVEDGRRILANEVASQIPIHRRYGGVVPELASRNHIRNIHAVLDEALDNAGVELDDIDGYAVTQGPGLVGSLLVGIETAKAIACALDRPCVGVNHIEGHLTTVLLELDDVDTPSFPYLALVVSGGHTEMFAVRNLGDYEPLGGTRDDAAGEAFDKVAKMLGLPYPGGVAIDRLARSGDPERHEFPRPMWTRANLDFSFSGLKTAVAKHLHTHGIPQGDHLADLCASFQEAVVDVLLMKALTACRKHELSRLVLSGGVACNHRLRQRARRDTADADIELFVAPPELCTDNAAMLGPIADAKLEALDERRFTAHRLRARSSVRLGFDDDLSANTPPSQRGLR